MLYQNNCRFRDIRGQGFAVLVPKIPNYDLKIIQNYVPALAKKNMVSFLISKKRKFKKKILI